MRRNIRDDSDDDDDMIAQEREFLQSRGAKPAATARRIGKQQQRVFRPHLARTTA